MDNSEDTEIGWTTRYVTASNDFLTVKAEMHPEAICKGATGWVFQQKPEQLPALPFDGDANDWAMSNGGIPGSGNYISLTVSVANEHDVTMEELGVIPVREDPPVTGTAPLLSGGCGPVTQAFFEADLDKDVVRPVAGQDSAGRKIEPAPMPRRLSPADPTEIWHLRANTEKCDCRFIPYFTFTVDGAEHKFEIPNGNWPWRVSSAKDAQLVHRLDERGEWVATPAGN